MFNQFNEETKKMSHKSEFEEKYNEACWYKGYYWGKPQEWDGTKLAKMKTVSFEPLQDAVEQFDVFLSELQKDDVQVVFVTSPIYLGVTEITENIQDFYSFRKHFSEKYSIPVLDYLYDSLCYDTAFFYNATHLNKTGAELFTTKLCNDINSLGLLRKN